LSPILSSSIDLHLSQTPDYYIVNLVSTRLFQSTDISIPEICI